MITAPALRKLVVLLRNVHDNLGDEAMLECEIAQLRELAGRIPMRLLVLTDAPQRISRLFDVEAEYSDVVLINPWQNAASQAGERRIWAAQGLARMMRGFRDNYLVPRQCSRFLAGGRLHPAQQKMRSILEQASLVISGGAMTPSVEHVRLARTAVLEFLARKGTPVFLNGQTIYFRNDVSAPVNLASLLITRDAGLSRANARSCGFPEAHIVDGTDPAFCLPPAGDREASAFLAGLGCTAPFAAVSLRSGVTKPAMEGLAGLLIRLAGEGRIAQVLLYGMQRHPAENDAASLGSFRELLKQQTRGCLPVAGPVSDWPSAGMLKAVLRRSAFSVACRYHGAVFSLTSARPVMALSVSAEYDLKMRGILRQFGKEQWLFSTAAGQALATAEGGWFAPDLEAELGGRVRELSLGPGRLAENVAALFGSMDAQRAQGAAATAAASDHHGLPDRGAVQSSSPERHFRGPVSS